MINSRETRTKMGRFYVDINVANYDDMAAARLGHLEATAVRRLTISGLVDSGASRLVLPKKVVEQLGLAVTEHIKVKYADGRTGKRAVVEGVYVELQGRHSIFKATVEPNRDTALIGALVLEDLDFLIDCERQRLVPRDPKFIVSEAEEVTEEAEMSTAGGPIETPMLPAPVLPLPAVRDEKWQREYSAFLAMLPQLLQTHAGKYVAIHEGRLVDFGDDKIELGLRAYRAYGHIAIYVGLATATPPVYRILERMSGYHVPTDTTG